MQNYDDYETPKAVLQDTNLTTAQKKKMLKAWRVDAEALARAAAEGLSGGEQSRLDAVTNALIALENK